MVSIILDCLAEGMSWDEIVTEYPSLKYDDIKIALSYAALLARNETVLLKQESS